MKSLSTFLVLAAILVFAPSAVHSQHKFKVKINGLSVGSDLYLAGYYGKKQYYRDTVAVAKNGWAVFEGETDRKCGIYSIVLPDKKSYFEFIVNEQEFELETDSAKLVESMKVKGSKENTIFFDYLRFIGDQGKKAEPLRNQLKKEGLDDKEKKRLREQLGVVDDAVKAYKDDLIAKNGDLLVSRILKASDDPVLPKTPPAGSDSTWSYKWFRAHYFDNLNLDDECLLRTPVFHQKLEYYMTKLVPQIPDSVIAAAHKIIEKARGNRETFKYVVHWITNHYEGSKIMCMDKVFVSMADRYYCTEKAWWVDSAQTAKICDRADKLRPLCCGERTPNVILQDTTEANWVNLYEFDAKYTVLFFWDPGCGHCKKAIPKMKEFHEKWDDKGVRIFGVCTEFETPEWKKFIIEKQLPWSEISDNPEINTNAATYLRAGVTTLQSLNFRDTYDIYSTPVIYVLDHEKRILAKRIGPEQIEGFVRDYDRANDNLLNLPKEDPKDDASESDENSEDSQDSKGKKDKSSKGSGKRSK